MNRGTSYGTKGTESAAAIVDRPYRGDGSKRGVIFCHGLNGQAWHPVNYPDPVLDLLAARGHPVLCPDLGGIATWGNDASQTKLGDARTYLQASLGAKSGGVLVYATSMGTLTALNYLRANGSHIAGLAIGLPAVDLQALHDGAPSNGLSAASIEAAYTNSAGYNAARAAHNPAENAAAYAGSLAAKIKLWYSSNDSIVTPAMVETFAAAAGVPKVSLGAAGHTVPASFAEAIADFLVAFN